MGFLYYYIFSAFSPFFPNTVMSLVCLSHTFFFFLYPGKIYSRSHVLFLSNPFLQPSAVSPALQRPIPLVMLSQRRWGRPRPLPPMLSLSSALSHSVSSMTQAVRTEWQSRAARHSTTAWWPELLALPERLSSSAGRRRVLANSESIPVQPAPSCPAGAWEPSDDFSYFLAKNSDQASVSRLDKGRGNSLVCYI